MGTEAGFGQHLQLHPKGPAHRGRGTRPSRATDKPRDPGHARWGPGARGADLGLACGCRREGQQGLGEGKATPGPGPAPLTLRLMQGPSVLWLLQKWGFEPGLAPGTQGGGISDVRRAGTQDLTKTGKGGKEFPLWRNGISGVSGGLGNRFDARPSRAVWRIQTCCSCSVGGNCDHWPGNWICCRVTPQKRKKDREGMIPAVLGTQGPTCGDRQDLDPGPKDRSVAGGGDEGSAPLPPMPPTLQREGGPVLSARAGCPGCEGCRAGPPGVVWASAERRLGGVTCSGQGGGRKHRLRGPTCCPLGLWWGWGWTGTGVASPTGLREFHREEPGPGRGCLEPHLKAQMTGVAGPGSPSKRGHTPVPTVLLSQPGLCQHSMSDQGT